MVLRSGLGKPDVTRIAGELTALERAPLLVSAEAASAQGLRQWRFGTARHLPDSRTARISDGDYFSGRARFIDTYVAASRQRFRNSRRGPRKRVYLIRGTLAIKNKPGFDVLGAECRQSSPRGTNMLLTTNGTRAFFRGPRTTSSSARARARWVSR